MKRFLALAGVFAVACGRAPANEPAQATPASAPPASVAGKSAAPAPTPVATAVDFEKLVALLPEQEGWTRTKPLGEQVTMGVPMSRARAEYARGDSSIDLEITDSSFNQLVLSPLTIFLAANFSERSSEGYTKSAPIGGNPGFEKWTNDSRRGEVTVVVNNRFIVQGIGHNVENPDPVRALVKAVGSSRVDLQACKLEYSIVSPK